MHPRNPYAKAPLDYAELAQRDTRLARFLRSSGDGRVSIDYQDPDAVRALTEATTLADFGVHVTLRPDRLCPPVPNRLNYIAWVDELIKATEVSLLLRIRHFADTRDEQGKQGFKRVSRGDEREANEILILDIGTGPYCIYPLLGCTLHSNWRFLATDIDEESIENAQSIITDPRNNGTAGEDGSRPRFAAVADSAPSFPERIRLVQRKKDDALLIDAKELSNMLPSSMSANFGERPVMYHVSMCNPPFYASQGELEASAAGKKGAPSAMTRGTPGEMIYEDGGEVGFVGRMIDESLAMAETQAYWYTSMLGKQASVAPLVAKLRQHDIDNYIVTEFVQGSKTRRWALAWSFTPFRVAEACVPTPLSLQHLAPARSFYEFTRDLREKEHAVLPTDSLDRVSGATMSLRSFLDGKGVSTLSDAEDTNDPDDEQINTFVAYAHRDTWTRKARRKQAQARDATLSASTDDPALVVRIRLCTVNDGIKVRVNWVYGRQHSLLESFALSLIRAWCTET